MLAATVASESVPAVDLSVGATSCQLCLPGSFSSNMGLAECMPCLPGYYTNTSNSTSCIVCPSGTYSDTYASSRCTPCPEGHLTQIEAAPSMAACIPCSSLYTDNPRCQLWSSNNLRSLQRMLPFLHSRLSLSLPPSFLPFVACRSQLHPLIKEHASLVAASARHS